MPFFEVVAFDALRFVAFRVPLRAAGRVEDPRRVPLRWAATLASSAAMRSSTSAPPSSWVPGSVVMSSPFALRSMRSSSSSRWVSWYRLGFQSSVSDSISCCAAFSSLPVTLARDGRPSMSLAATTSSGKSIVSTVSDPSTGRMAARCCLVCITNRPTPIRPDASMAWASSA